MSNSYRHFHLVTLVSDALGLSSFHRSPWLPGKIYRWTAVVAITVVHVLYVNATPFAWTIQSVFYRARIWCLFSSSVAVYLAQMLQTDGVRLCHLRCADFPTSSPFLRLLLHFFIFLSHLLIYHFFYSTLSVSQNSTYFLVLIFCVQVPGLQFDFLISSIRGRISAVNDDLAKFIGRGEPNFFFVGRYRGKEEKILELHRRYQVLAELAARATSVYAVQVLVVIIAFTLEVFFVIETALFDIIAGKPKSNVLLDSLFTTYIVFSLFYKICELTRSGERYQEECSRTDIILCQIANTDPGDNSETRRFILHKIIEPSSVPILGIFHLNYELLYTIGCGIVNYGIITAIIYMGLLDKREHQHHK